MGTKHFVISLLFIGLTYLVDVSNGQDMAYSSEFVATGIANGLDIKHTIVPGASTNVICLADWGDNATEGYTATMNTPFNASHAYVQAGFYNVTEACFVDDRDFDVGHTADLYIGTMVHGLDGTNQTNDIVMPIKMLPRVNITYPVFIELGTDMSVVVTVKDTAGAVLTVADTDNGTIIFELDYQWFPALGFYAIEINASNAFNLVSETVLFVVEYEIQNAVIEITSSPDAPYYVLVNQSFVVTARMTAGSGVTFSVTIINSDGSVKSIFADHQNGTVASRLINMMVDTTGIYTFMIDLSNFVSSYSLEWQVEVLETVNSIDWDSDRLLLMNTETVTFTLAVLNTASFSMGVVTCDIDFGNGVNESHEFELNVTSFSEVALTQVQPTQQYIAGWYIATAFCQNGLKPMFNGRITTLTLPVGHIIVENDVSTVVMSHDSPNTTYHPFSTPIEWKIVPGSGADLPLANVSCEFKMEGLTTVVNGSVNATNAVVYPHRFRSPDQTFTVNINCSNYQTFKTFTETVTTYADCWKSKDFFDPMYRDKTNPLIVYTHNDFELSGNVRMTGHCNGTYKTIWTQWKVVYDNDTEEVVSNHTTTNIQTTYTYLANKENPGFYKFALTTVFLETEGVPTMGDFVYVQYRLFPLTAKLTDANGGENPTRMVSKNESFKIDSVHSSDPAHLLPYLSGTHQSRTWACRTRPGILESEVTAFIVTGTPISGTLENCDVKIPEQGVVTQAFPSETLTVDQWYIFTMTWIKGARSATAHQGIVLKNQPPLAIELRCMSNCKPGDGSLTKVALAPVEINVLIFTPNILTADYRWTLSRDTNMSANFVDITGNLSTTSSGFQIPVETLLQSDMDVVTAFVVECRVIAKDYEPTTAFKFFVLNLPPYAGSCSITNGLGQSLANEVTAGTSEVCFTCSNWKDEGLSLDRNPQTDMSSGIKYDLVQLFLQDDGQVNTSLSVISIGRQIQTTGCMVVSLHPNGKFANNTRFDVRVSDDFFKPLATTSFVLTAGSPINSATNEQLVSDIEALVTYSSSQLNEFIDQQNSEALLTASTPILSVLATVQVVEEPKPDLTNLVVLEEGQTQNDVIDTFVAVPVISNVTLKLQQETEKLISNVLQTMVASNADDSKTLDNPDLAIKALSAVSVLAGSSQKNVNTKTMGDAVSIVGKVTSNAIKATEEVTPAVVNVMNAATQTFENLAEMIVPEETSAQLPVSDLEGLRAERLVHDAFMSDRQLEEREESPFTTEELDFMNSQKQKEILMQIDDKINASLRAFEEKKKFDNDVLNNAKNSASVGSKNTYGSDKAMLTVTRDTANSLAAGFTTGSIDLKIDAMGSFGDSKVTLAVSEMKSALALDTSGWSAKTRGQQDIMLDTDDPISGRMTVTSQSEVPKFETIYPVTSEEDASGPWSYHRVYISTADEDLNVVMQRMSDNVKQYNAYIAYEGTVSKLNYVAMRELTGELKVGAMWSTVFRPSQRPGGETGIWSLAIETVFFPEAEDTGSRKRRSAHNATGDPPYNISMVTTACILWDKEVKKWTAGECEGNYNPQVGKLDCTCPAQKHMTLSSAFVVPVNGIDWSTVFLRFSPLNQAAVMGTLITIFIIYILVMIWARRQDRKDLLKWGITPLSDNFAEDNYFYVIRVFTGMRPNSGTRSKISIIVAGEEMDTGIRELYDGVRREFSTGSVMNFLLSTPVYLGDLEYVRLWHDNSGGSNYASWYLSRIEVQDVQRDETFIFQSQRWLAVEKEDGQLDTVLPVCKTENMNVFTNRFFFNAKDNLAESHMWISVVYRPQSSVFTRCQRVSVGLVFIMLTMVSNAMFFKGTGDDGNIETGADVQVGPFRFSLQQVYVSFICALIVTSMTLILIYLYKMARVKPGTNPDDVIFRPRQRKEKYRIPLMHDWLEREQQKSIELEKHLVQKGYPKMEGFKLPHQCRSLAWFLVFLTTVLCAFFIMLWSMMWGKKKSEEWLTTFFLSFFESVFCLDPVKVAAMALVFALIFRSTKDSESVINRSTIMKKYSANMRSKSGGVRLPAPPLDQKKIKKERDVRQREITMKRAFRGCVTNLIMIFVLFSIAYSNRDSRSHTMYAHTNAIFLEPEGLLPDGSKLPKFSKIMDYNSFYDWLNQTFIPAMFPETDTSGRTLHWRRRQFVEDEAKYRVGPPRLRQLRTTKLSCSNPYFDTKDCFKQYTTSTEATDNYCIAWRPEAACTPQDAVYKVSYDAWKFTSSLDIWGIPIAGTYTTYGGGGYIAKLAINKKLSEAMIEELYLNSWVDRQTRAVIVEFTLYCLNANIFTYNMFMVEFPETGGALTFSVIYPMKVYQHLGTMGIYTLACEIVFLLFVICYTIMTVVGVVQEKCAYFKLAWNLFDLVFLILSYVCIIMYIIRTVMTNHSLEVFKEDKKAFVNFYHIAIWDQMLVLLIGCLCFMATIRMLYVLGYNKRIGAVARVFTNAASDLIWFGIFFFTCFTCYCLFGYLLFGAQLNSYKTVFKTMGTLFISMIGKSKFAEIDDTNPIMAKIYFIVFIMFMVYFILTMFLAMLSKAIDQVHADASLSKDDEMVEYLIRKLKGFLSFGNHGDSTAGNSVRPAPGVPPAPWSNEAKSKRKLKWFDNRRILQDIRSTLLDAIAGNPRDFKTPDHEKKKRSNVSFRK